MQILIVGLLSGAVLGGIYHIVALGGPSLLARAAFLPLAVRPADTQAEPLPRVSRPDEHTGEERFESARAVLYWNPRTERGVVRAKFRISADWREQQSCSIAQIAVVQRDGWRSVEGKAFPLAAVILPTFVTISGLAVIRMLSVGPEFESMLVFAVPLLMWFVAFLQELRVIRAAVASARRTLRNGGEQQEGTVRRTPEPNPAQDTGTGA